MTEPTRWLESDEAPEGVAALLAAARPFRTLDTVTRARSRRRLAAMSALPAAAGVMFWMKSVALGAVLGSVVTASVAAIKWPERQPVQAPMVAEKASIRTRAPVKPVKLPESDLAPEPSATPSSVAPVAVANGVSTARAAPSAAPGAQSLEREILLLERARQLMKVNPAMALSALDQHRREFSSGTLVLERQFLEVEALLQLGRRDQAIARAADLRARAPGSLYERRLTQLLNDE